MIKFVSDFNANSDIVGFTFFLHDQDSLNSKFLQLKQQINCEMWKEVDQIKRMNK